MRRLAPWGLVFALCASACRGDEGPPPSSAQVPNAGQIRISVASAQASMGQIEFAAASVGVVDAWQDADLRAEVGGRVRAVEVDNGDRVEVGELLVRIDVSRQAAAAAAARAQVEGLEEDLDFARSEAERKQRLLERGSVAPVTLDAAQHGVTKAESGLAAARAQLSSARRQVADGRIEAPIAGIVTQRMVDPGDTAVPGAPLLQIVDLSRLRVRVGVSGPELSGLTLGSQAEVRIEDLGGLALEAEVVSIAPAANPRTGLFDVELHAENPGAQVRAGMVASVRLQSAQREPRVLVPREAVTRRGGQTVVFQIVEEVVHIRPVRLGASGRDRIEILEGLEEGAEVATSALHALAEGVEVERMPATADTPHPVEAP